MKRTAGFAALAALGLPILAEDLTLAGGRILHEVVYSEANPASVLVKAREGTERVDLVDLPPELQGRFHFDPTAALRFLSAENRRLRGEVARVATLPPAAPAVVASPAAATAWASRPATPAPASLPPLPRDAVVDVFDLVHHYRGDATAAAARYKGRDFVIEGFVERIEAGLVGRGAKVLLESPDRSLRVVVEWRIPDEYPKFYTKAEGRRLFGGSGGAHRLVLSAGDRVRFAVRGGAYDDAAVFLGRAELKSREAAATP
jgi:hypothetical protein